PRTPALGAASPAPGARRAVPVVPGGSVAAPVVPEALRPAPDGGGAVGDPCAESAAGRAPGAVMADGGAPAGAVPAAVPTTRFAVLGDSLTTGLGGRAPGDGSPATLPPRTSALGAASPAPGARRAVPVVPGGSVAAPVVPEALRPAPDGGGAVGDPCAESAAGRAPGAVMADGGAPAGAVPAAVPTTRFAALGDSLTEGLGDPVTGGGWRGWAALLAGVAGPHGEAVDFVNVSRSGALAADVAGEQLSAARRARPHLASVVVGMNDTLRDTFDIRRVAEALDATIGALRADGTVVLTACLPDPGRMLGLPDALARPLGRRMRAVNTVVHALSGRYGAVHVELTEHTWVTDRAAWSVDRLHPSELGHRLLAREFHSALTARGIAMGDPPSTALDGPTPSRAASAWWMATRGTRWVVDRCTDLLPGLLALAAQEVRHRVRGTGHLLDGHERRAALAALASLPSQARTGPGTSPPHAATMAG
uniref:SGNH/GDSL hydrolase family protein n=1 Tax=Streptomyces sp. NEAU-S77 TaxID=3411033 RepID=UPI003B9DC7A3